MSTIKAFAFALVVGLAAQAIDIMFHMSGESLFGVDIAVHLPYVLVKLTIITWTLFLFSRWVGVNRDDGITASFAASVMFDIYYNYAEPTLDRTVFTLDEAAIFIIVHFFCIVIPYLLIWKWLMNAPVMGEGALTNDAPLYKVIPIGIVIGSIFLFPTKNFLKAYNLTLGLSYNDHVLIGALAFIMVVVALYKLLIRPQKI